MKQKRRKTRVKKKKMQVKNAEGSPRGATHVLKDKTDQTEYIKQLNTCWETEIKHLNLQY